MEARKTRLLTAVLPRVDAGQVWRDHDVRGACRYIVVLFTYSDGRVEVQRCHLDGSEYAFTVRGRQTRAPAPRLETHITRFVHSGRKGFTLVQDVVPVAA